MLGVKKHKKSLLALLALRDIFFKRSACHKIKKDKKISASSVSSARHFFSSEAPPLALNKFCNAKCTSCSCCTNKRNPQCTPPWIHSRKLAFKKAENKQAAKCNGC